MRSRGSLFGLEVSVRDALVAVIGAVSLGYGMTNFQTKSDAAADKLELANQIAMSDRRADIRLSKVEGKLENADTKLNEISNGVSYIKGKLEPK